MPFVVLFPLGQPYKTDFRQAQNRYLLSTLWVQKHKNKTDTFDSHACNSFTKTKVRFFFKPGIPQEWHWRMYKK